MSAKIDSVVAQWLEEGPHEGPAAGLDRAIQAVHAVDQRPTWVFPRRWLPESLANLELRVPPLALVAVLLALLLLLMLGLAALWAGGHDHVRNYLGPSGNGLIAFSDGRTIDVAHVDGTDRRTVSRAQDVAQVPLFSPDGSKVAYIAGSSSGSPAGLLVVVQVDGRSSVVVSGDVAVTANEVANFAWSPDGTRIAFAGTDQGVSRIYMTAIDGSSPNAISDASSDRDLPSWSRDGQWITFRTSEPDGVRRHLDMTHPDGSEEQRLASVIAEDAYLSRLHWAPNTDSTAYAINVGYETDTEAIIDLGFGHIGEMWKSGIGGLADAGVPWSPDGRFLAILSAQDGVIVADNDLTSPYDGQLRNMGSAASCWIDWSPDGTALLGGSGSDCSTLVVIPIADPKQAATLPMTVSGMASWQAVQR